MKVCVISGDAVGGLRKHVHDVIRAVPTDISLLYIHSNVTDSAATKDFEEFRYLLIARTALRIPKSPGVSDVANLYRIWRLCRKEKVDLFHGHAAKGGLYARIVGVLMRKPVIYTPHGGSVHARFGSISGSLFAAIEFLLKHFTKLFIFESNYTRDAFHRLAGSIPADRELINYNGINVELFRETVSWEFEPLGRHVRLLTVGLLSFVKGQDLAIDATAILKQRGWNVRLDICGDGDERPALEALVARCNLKDHVYFHGDVADVRPYYESCDVVLIGSRFESFGYVAVEAALMGRPVIASRTGGLLETVIDGQTGFHFEPGNAVSLANTIEKSLNDPESTRQRVSAARIRTYEQFDREVMTSRLYCAYRKLVK